MTQYLSIPKAAKHVRKSKQALYRAICRGTLQSIRIDGLLYTTTNWLDFFEEHKGESDRIKKHGRRLFDAKKGTYNVKQVAKILNVLPSQVYDYIYKGKMRSFRYGDYQVIDKEEIKAMKVKLKQKRDQQKTA